VPLDDLAAAAASVHAGEYAWIGRGVDHIVDRGQRVEIAGDAQVGMADRDAAFLQGAAV